MGKLLSAKKILIGSVSPLGRTLVINVRIIDVEKGVSEFAAMGKARSEDVLDETVEVITNKLSNRIESSESGVVRKKPGVPWGIDISVTAAYIIPNGDFSEMFDPGYGGLLCLSKKDFIIGNPNLYYGIESGYITFPGKHERVDSMYMIPLFLNVSYRFNLFDSFSIAPKITGGYSYNSIEYDERTIFNEESYTTESEFEPVVMAGFLINYTFGSVYTFHLGASYGAIIESDDPNYFTSINAGIGMSL